MGSIVARVLTHALVGVCVVAAAKAQDEVTRSPVGWFADGAALTKAVEDGVDEWFETERKYLANVAKMSLAFDDGDLSLPTATRVCFVRASWKDAPEGEAPPGSHVASTPGADGGDGQDGDEGGADGEDGDDAKMRIVDTMSYVELTDEPFGATVTLSKSGKTKEVPVRIWVGRSYGEPTTDERWLGTLDVEQATESHPFPPHCPDDSDDWVRSTIGQIGETSDGDPVVAYIDVPLEHLPPLTSVQVWTLGTVTVSGTKQEVGEKAIAAIQGSRKSAFVFNRTYERDERLFDGPVSLVCFGKVLKPKDTIEPEIIFGEEKNYRYVTMYAASASYGVVRASAFEGLLRDGRYMATRELRDFRDVFGRNDVAELEYKKSNYTTLDKFNSTSTLWKDFWHDHAYAKGKSRRR